MKVLNWIIKAIYLALYSVIQFVLMIIGALVDLRSFIDLLPALMYQPIIIVSVLLLFVRKIDELLELYTRADEKGAVIFGLVIVGILIIAFVFAVNAVIELFYLFRNCKERYEVIFQMQSKFYNYTLVVISLIAFWIAYDRRIDPITANIELLVGGCLAFACVVLLDVYGYFLHEPGIVFHFYEKIINKHDELFGSEGN